MIRVGSSRRRGWPAARPDRYPSRDGSFAVGRAGRDLHAPLQHRASPARCSPSTWPTCPNTAAGRSARSSSACSRATFYLAELVLSPLFGVLSDRLGHHRVMLFGPVVRGGRGRPDRVHGGPRRRTTASCSRSSAPRVLDPAARGRVDGRQHPVDPGLHRDGHGRRRAPARQGRRPASRARRWPALGAGFALAPLLFAALGPVAFFLNAASLRRLVPHLPVRRRGPGRRTRPTAPGAACRAAALPATSCAASHVWLLAPTWIAVNASIGLWFSQSIFQFAQGRPATSPTSACCSGFSAGPDLARRRRHRV